MIKFYYSVSQKTETPYSTTVHTLPCLCHAASVPYVSSKTKEMILGHLAQTNLPLLTVTTTTDTTETVTSFKLLGVYMDSSLSCTTHINNITKKATRRLYFLKQLKRAGLTTNQLLHYYTVVIRPVLEYCAPAWHYALTKTQAEQQRSHFL